MHAYIRYTCASDGDNRISWNVPLNYDVGSSALLETWLKTYTIPRDSDTVTQTRRVEDKDDTLQNGQHVCRSDT